MRSKPCEEDPNVNIVLRSEIMIEDDKVKHPEEDKWVSKAPEKEFGFNLECPKEKFMEAKKIFVEASTSGSQGKVQETNMRSEVDPSVLTTFLETCIKLLCDSKTMEFLQELINKCANKEKVPEGH